uniref:Uncharacterized protein n=1 Tax=Timema monikensis TaxID=170555 RepID=A0A7R9HMW9_9NEOP|nr:unnamed protein product [Timema monikensis]
MTECNDRGSIYTQSNDLFLSQLVLSARQPGAREDPMPWAMTSISILVSTRLVGSTYWRQGCDITRLGVSERQGKHLSHSTTNARQERFVLDRALCRRKPIFILPPTAMARGSCRTEPCDGGHPLTTIAR